MVYVVQLPYPKIPSRPKSRTRPLVVHAPQWLLLSLLLLVAAGCSTTTPPTTSPVLDFETALEVAEQRLEAGEPDAAIQGLLPFETTQASDPRRTLLLARAHFAAERYAESIDFAQQTVDLAPDDAQHQLWLGRALSERVQRVPALQKLPLARRLHDAFRRAVELDPENPGAHLALARFYSEAPPMAGGDNDLAFHHIERLLELEPATGHRRKGLILERLKRLEEAESELRTSLELDATNAETLREFGLFLVRQDRKAEALPLLEQSLEIEPDEDLRASVAKWQAEGT